MEPATQRLVGVEKRRAISSHSRDDPYWFWWFSFGLVIGCSPDWSRPMTTISGHAGLRLLWRNIVFSGAKFHVICGSECLQRIFEHWLSPVEQEPQEWPVLCFGSSWRWRYGPFYGPWPEHWTLKIDVQALCRSRFIALSICSFIRQLYGFVGLPSRSWAKATRHSGVYDLEHFQTHCQTFGKRKAAVGIVVATVQCHEAIPLGMTTARWQGFSSPLVKMIHAWSQPCGCSEDTCCV